MLRVICTHTGQFVGFTVPRLINKNLLVRRFIKNDVLVFQISNNLRKIALNIKIGFL